jgi:cytoskeletal protein CcmA (bactofilin family)
VGYFSQNKPQDKPSRDGNHVNGAGGETKTTAAAITTKKSSDVVSTLGPDMTVTGNIVSEGSVQILGRVVGDIQASQVAVGEGAQVEGNITAHDVAVNGTFKGTIRGQNVKLRGAAVVDGEVLSKSLTVEENVQFEGVSRRLEKPVELQSALQPPTLSATGSVPLAVLGNGSLPVA